MATALFMSARVFLRRVACVFLLVFTVPAGAPCQEVPSSETGASELSEDRGQLVQKQLDELQQPGRKEELGELYEPLVTRLSEAVARFRRADGHGQRADEFRRDAADAPTRLLEIQSELQKATNGEPLIPDPTLSLGDLETRLREAEAEHTARSEELTGIDAEELRRQERRAEIGGETVDATRELEQARTGLESAVGSDEPALLANAQRTLWTAQAAEAEAKLELLREESSSYDLRRDLLIARKERATRRRSQSEKRLNFWRQEVETRRQAELERQRLEAERVSDSSHESVRTAADEFAALVEERARILDSIADTDEKLDQAQADRERLQDQYQMLRTRVDAELHSDLIGRALRNQRAEIPSPRRLDKQIRARSMELATALVRRQELEHVREELTDLASAVERRLSGLPEPPEEVTAELARVLDEQRRLVSNLSEEYVRLDSALTALDTEEILLRDLSAGFLEFIDENVLWIRSHGILSFRDLGDVSVLPRTLIGHENLRALLSSAGRGAASHPVLFTLLGLTVAGLGALRRRFRSMVLSASDLVTKKGTDSFVYSVQALAASLGLAVFLPGALALGALLLLLDAEATDAVRAMGRGLLAAAIASFPLLLLWRVSQKGGLGDTHFRWRPRSLSLIRRWMPLWLLVIVPLETAVIVSEAARRLEPQESFGRIAFIATHLLLAWFLHCLLRPQGGVMEDVQAKSPKGAFSRFLWLWYPLVVGGPVVLAALAFSGFYYTAWNLALSFEQTLWLVLALVIAQSLVARGSFVAWRKLAMQQAQRRREDEAAAQEGTATPEAPAPEEPSMDLWAINQQTRQLLRTGTGFALLIGLWLIWAEVVPALGVLDEVPLWTQSSQVEQIVQAADGEAAEVRTVSVESSVTLLDVIVALFVVVLTMAAARNVPGVLEITLLQRLPLEPGGRYAVTTLVRYVITAVGLVVAFTLLGLEWSKVQWLVAAMTVGLGFGLQEIFANFVSGLILLFERPIRLGDTVTVGTVSGTVSKIRIRATTITDWDRKELVVPNKEFVTGQIINWSLSDPILRLVIPVGVAYGSDTKMVQNALLKVARRNKVALKEPAPQAYFVSFGDSSLNFELRVFLPNFDHLVPTRHELHMAIEDEFRKSDIEIPFPQRDLHLRSAGATLQILDRKTQEILQERPLDGPDD